MNQNMSLMQYLENSNKHILSCFDCSQLSGKLQEIYKPFAELAEMIADRNPNNPETNVALRKLLEAKESAIIAGMD